MWKMSGRDRHTMHTTVAKKFERENNKYSPFLAISQLFAAGQKEKGDFNAVRDSFNNWPNGLQFRFFISSLITYQNGWWFIFTKLIIPFFVGLQDKIIRHEKSKMCLCLARSRLTNKAHDSRLLATTFSPSPFLLLSEKWKKKKKKK